MWPFWFFGTQEGDPFDDVEGTRQQNVSAIYLIPGRYVAKQAGIEGSDGELIEGRSE